MPDPPPIVWRVHLQSAVEQVFDAWTTDVGRMSFWAEKSVSTETGFLLVFPNDQAVEVSVAAAVPFHRFEFTYFGGSSVSVTFDPAGGGCDVTLREQCGSSAVYLENRAGWIAVLLALKARVDFGIDLRSHDRART